MGKLSLILICMQLLCINPNCIAQSSVLVTDPRLELRGNTINISYDILNSKSSDYFEVGVEISDDKGKKIDAGTFSGDVGKGVSGGFNKLIQWDLDADRIVLNEKIYFEIIARTIAHSELVQIGRKNILEESRDEENNTMNNLSPVSISKSFSGAGIVFQSLFFPGLGLSRVTGNPHWLRGLVGYGFIAGSVVLNIQSFNTYQGIEDYTDFDDKVAQFQKSINQDDISEVFAYAAMGLWATDLIWNLIGISSFKKRSLVGNYNGISIKPGFDPLTYAATVGITYRF